MVRPADAAAELVEIGQTVAVGLVDEHRVGPRNVETTFDDRRRQQDVDAAGHEAEHHVFELRLREPAMHDADRGLGGDLLQSVGHLLDVENPVVDEKYLPLAGQFPVDGRADEPVVPPHHTGLDGDAVGRRRGEIGDVADAEHRHVERAGNRRGCHREHVDTRPQRLEPLLHVDAKPLLLVDHEQAKVGEVDVGLGEPVSADHDIDLARGEALERVAFFGRAREPRERPDRERKLGVARREAAAVLLGEHGRGHEHGHLRPRLGHLEGGPHRKLRLAEADVAAEQPIHRPRSLQVVPNCLDGGELVGRLVERKRLLKLPLPGRVGRKGIAWPACPPRLQGEHVGGHVGQRVFDGLLLFFPQRAADLGELGGEFAAADIFLDKVDRRGRHVDLRALGKLDLQKLLGAALLLQQLEPPVATDAVGDMDDVIALVEIEKGVDRPGEPLARGPRCSRLFAAEELGTADEHDLLRHQSKAAGEMPLGKVEPGGAIGRGAGEEFRQPPLLGLTRGDHPHLLITAHRLQFLANPIKDAGEPLHAFDGQRGRGLEARRGDGRECDRWVFIDAGEDIFRLAHTAHVGQPLLGPPGLLGQFAWLHERPPAAGRHDVGQMCATRRRRAVGGPVHERREVDRGERVDAPLGDRVECAQRLDLVAKEFDANGPAPVGGEEIDDPAAAGKRAGGVDRIDLLPAPGDEPVAELGRIEPPADLQPPCALLDLAGIVEQRQQGLDRGDDDPGMLVGRPCEPLHEREPLRLGWIGECGVIGLAERLERRQHGDAVVGEDR